MKKTLILLCCLAALISCGKKKEQVPEAKPFFSGIIEAVDSLGDTAKDAPPSFYDLQEMVERALPSPTNEPLTYDSRKTLYSKFVPTIQNSVNESCTFITTDILQFTSFNIYPEGSQAKIHLQGKAKKVGVDECRRTQKLAHDFDTALKSALNNASSEIQFKSAAQALAKDYLDKLQINAGAFSEMLVSAIVGIDAMTRGQVYYLERWSKQSGAGQDIPPAVEKELNAILDPVSAEIYNLLLQVLEDKGTPREQKTKDAAKARIKVLEEQIHVQIKPILDKYTKEMIFQVKQKQFTDKYGAAAVAPYMPSLRQNFMRLDPEDKDYKTQADKIIADAETKIKQTK